MRAAVSQVYPLLFVLVPLLSLAANNPGEYEAWDLVQVAGALVLAVGGLITLFSLAVRGRSRGTASALALIAVAWFYEYPRLRYLPAGVPLAALATVVATVWLTRKRPNLSTFARFMTCMGLLLIGWSGLVLARQRVLHSAVERHPLVRALGEPIQTSPVQPQPTSSRPDIYLIVLDEYASAAVLRDQLGFDNHAFEDSLRNLGFIIPEVRSNYGETFLSIPSLLNFAHLTKLEPELRASEGDPAIPLYLVANNRAARFLKAQGYTYVIHSGWHGSNDSPMADLLLRPARRSFGIEQLDRSDLRRVFLAQTMLSRFLQPGIPADQVVLRGFDLVQDVSRLPTPTFTLAHFMLPHHPYRFSSTCGPAVGARDPERGSAEDRIAYRHQLECTNRQVLRLVHALLERSPERPVIILQGDHGTRMVADFATVGDSLFQAQVRERFAAFGAYYLPNGGDSLFRARVSVVNILRNVLVHYFGADLPLESDSSYFFHGDSNHFTPADTGPVLAH